MVRVEYRPIKGGKSVRLVYYIKGKRYRERLDIQLKNRDPDLKRKKQIIEGIRSKRELELVSESYGIAPEIIRRGLIDFLDAFIRDSSLKSIEKYESLRVHADLFFGKRIMADVTKYEVSGFLEFLYSRVSISSANTYFTCLSRIFKDAVSKNYVTKNVCKDVRKRSDPPARIKHVLNVDEFRKLMDVAYSNRDNGLREASILAFYTGLGYAECRSLLWENIRGGFLRYTRKKNGRKVVVPLKEKVELMLGDRSGRLVFPNLPTRVAARRMLITWVERSGIDKHITFYCFRHSFAVNLLLHGADLKTVSNLMGHADIKMTVKYLNYVDSLKGEAIDRLPDL